MATKRRSPDREPQDRIVKRAPQDRKRLPPDLEAFARGDDDALWRRQLKSGRLHDPRVVALIPGLKNADARAVYDAHLSKLLGLIDDVRAARGSDDAAALASARQRLAEALAVSYLCGVHRGQSIVSFDAFVDAVLRLPLDEARALVREGRASLGLEEGLTDAQIALYLRVEAGVLEATRSARVSVKGGMLRIAVPLASAADALASVGFRAAPLARNAEGPRTVVDRPKGVLPMSAIIEREERARRGED